MTLNEFTIEEAVLGWSRLRAASNCEMREQVTRGQISNLGYAVGHTAWDDVGSA